MNSLFRNLVTVICMVGYGLSSAEPIMQPTTNFVTLTPQSTTGVTLITDKPKIKLPIIPINTERLDRYVKRNTEFIRAINKGDLKAISSLMAKNHSLNLFITSKSDFVGKEKSLIGFKQFMAIKKGRTLAIIRQHQHKGRILSELVLLDNVASSNSVRKVFIVTRDVANHISETKIYVGDNETIFPFQKAKTVSRGAKHEYSKANMALAYRSALNIYGAQLAKKQDKSSYLEKMSWGVSQNIFFEDEKLIRNYVKGTKIGMNNITLEGDFMIIEYFATKSKASKKYEGVVVIDLSNKDARKYFHYTPQLKI